MTAPTPSGQPRRHVRSVNALIIVGTLVGLLAVFAVWAKRQLLEESTYTETSSQLLENANIRTAVAGFLVTSLYDNVDVQGELQAVLPERAQPLAGPVAGGLRELANRVALEALQRPAVQLLWQEANQQAHTALLRVIEGGGPVVSTTGGDVNLDLGALVEQVGAQAGIDAAGKIPPGVAEIGILDSGELSLAQDSVDLLQKLYILLPLLGLAIYGLAIYLARGWRREAVRGVGVAFITIGLVVLVSRKLGGNYLVDSLTTTAAAKPAAQSAWDILTSLLRDGGIAMMGYGVAIVLGAWLAGPRPVAIELRRTITPALRDRRVAYAVLGGIVLLILWWSPTEGTRRLGPSVILLALLIAGMEALRAQAVVEFPDASGGSLRERIGAAFGSPPAADAAAPSAGDERLEKLGQLGQLRDGGLLDEEEFRREKQRILGE